MDLLKKYLEEILLTAKNKKIIVLGCRGSGAVTFCALRALGIEVEYFVDIYTDGKTKMFFGKHVYTIDHLQTEKPGSFFVIDVFPYLNKMESRLERIGLCEGRDFSSIHSLFKSKYCDKHDPLLGFTRDDDLVGFKQFGCNEKDALKIVTIGGSTTDYSYSLLKSWPEILHNLLSDKGIKNIVFNGGICGYMSAQERDKVLRDAISLSPDYIISLSGVNDIAWNHCNSDTPYYSKYVVEEIINSMCIENTSSNNDDFGLGLKKTISDYENWYNNHKIIHGAAKAFGLKYRCILQPCIFTGDYKKSDFEASWLKILLDIGLEEHKAIGKIFSKWSEFYSGAKTLMAEESYMFDGTEIFNDLIGVYIDGIHCDENANKAIAQFVLEKVICYED